MSASALSRDRQPVAAPSAIPQPAVPSPVRTVYRYRPDASTSSRRLSASFTAAGPLSSQPTTACSSVTASTDPRHPAYDHPGPLTSHPTTEFSYMAASGSRGGFDRFAGAALRPSLTTSNLPAPSTYQKYARRASPTNIPSSKTSTAATYTASTAIPRFKVEKAPSSSSTISLGTKHKDSLDIAHTKFTPKQAPKSKVKAGGGIPKSRTMNVLSNLTAPFSRTSSLASFARSESRHASGSSAATSNVAAPPAVARNTAAGASTQNLNSAMPPSFNGIRLIHTAQSSAYWTGRFMALQDKFQVEKLLPGNLTTLVGGHAEQSSTPAATGGRPQISLPISHTTACLSSSAATPRMLQRQQQPLMPKQNQHARSNSTASATSPLTSKPGSSAEAAALLLDEDNCSKRAFLHLEALCTTNEARKSLHAWQQNYARRMGKENLLPKGGTMEDKEKGWVGRLFSGGSYGKKSGYSAL
ncbi:hypothetical protein AAE478_008082 [Parahypoxylon ruwenzoriense]